MPPGAAHIWAAFVALHATRTVGFTANPITWGEIVAYQAITGPLTAWEIDTIRRLDAAWMDSNRETPQ